jgi:biotin transport system substrate-specific component
MNGSKVFLSLCIMIASAYASFTIPITDTGIPFTLQSLAVFVVAGFLNYKESAICIFSYLLLGTVGLPVFADGSSGLSKLIGASGGFLFGFLVAGVFISFFRTRIKDNLISLVGIMIAATVILFACGLLQLAIKLDGAKAIEYGLLPFWRMGLVKAVLAAFIVNGILNVTNRQSLQNNN